MPRFGVVTARRNAGSSSLLTISRSQAHRSLISARSKKLCPPETLYGMPALRSAFSNTRAWWLARYSTAKSLNSTAAPPVVAAAAAPATCAPRRAWKRVTTRSASCSSLSHSITRTGSPSPNALHSFFSNSLGLWAITWFAARRMWPVER